MKNLILVSLLLGLIVNSTAQNCFFTEPGKAGSGTSSPCGSNLCYKLTSGLAAADFGTPVGDATNGILNVQTNALTTALVAGDKGCLPTVSGTVGGAVPQTTIATMVLQTAANANYANLVTQYPNLIKLFCTTKGTCCSSNNCNSAEIIGFNKKNLIFMLFSIISAKFFF